MKKYIPTIIFALVFLTGLSVMLYPTVSDFINERNQSKVISNYEAIVANMTPEDYTNEWNAAHAYNEYIRSFPNISAAVNAEIENPESAYETLLNIAGNSVMGVIEIPSIHISLPVYHTTEDPVLQVGAGHYVGSSLPAGGTGTHCVITGHRGLPSAKLFTDLDQITERDRFYLKIMDQVLAYQVNQIQVVLPEEMDGLSVVPGEDYITLVTCTPYGINSHRLLIRGTRVTYESELDKEKTTVFSPILQGENVSKIDRVPLILAGVIFLCSLILVWLIKHRHYYRKDGNQGEKDGKNNES